MWSDGPTPLAWAVWCACIAYFFGFFGIGFVDMSEAVRQRGGKGEIDGEEGPFSEGPFSQRAGSPPRALIPTSPKRLGRHSHDFNPVCNPSTSNGPTPVAVRSPAPSKPAPSKAPPPPSEVASLSDSEVASLVLNGTIKDHTLESVLSSPTRAVSVRRLAFSSRLPPGSLDGLPSGPSLDYGRVHGANCEIVVGYVPIPVGIAGPITLNGETTYIPMATTEGCLVASTNRGCKAITASGGARAYVVRDGITRAPCLKCESTSEAVEVAAWCEGGEGGKRLRDAFESTTSFGKLVKVCPTVAGKNVYLRLTCRSGDAMGMNMVSKGSLAAVSALREAFPTVQLVALSGNMCTDKKPSAINWIEGRGKSVVIECVVKKSVVERTLKTTVDAIVDVNLQKNLIGSAMSGSIGGFNAHAANNVTAVYLATGQDPAQNVESSNCITLFEATPSGDLWMSCTMPSIEVGTVGGGTTLPAQSSMLSSVGCAGGSRSDPGSNARRLATVVAAAVMAGELSLVAALAANTLVSAHMQHNRKK